MNPDFGLSFGDVLRYSIYGDDDTGDFVYLADTLNTTHLLKMLDRDRSNQWRIRVEGANTNPVLGLYSYVTLTTDEFADLIVIIAETDANQGEGPKLAPHSSLNDEDKRTLLAQLLEAEEKFVSEGLTDILSMIEI